MPTFTTQIIHPITEEVVSVDVEYEMRDRGVLMKQDENVQPVILSVRVPATNEQLIDEIGECAFETIHVLAGLHNKQEQEAMKETFRPEREDES